MKITNPITLDVARSNSYICLLAKQFDENSRFLIATLTNNGKPMIIPAGATVTLRATRPDGEPVAVPGIINNDGTTTVEIDDYILEVVGSASLSIEVAIGDEILTSASFNLTIQRADGNGWLRVYVAAASLAAGNYYITIGDTPYAFTTTQAIPAGGSVYFASEGGTAQTRDASGNVLDASLPVTIASTGTELTSDVPTMSFLAAIAGRMATIEAEMSQKANIDGSYPLLHAGTADNIIADTGATQAIPFIQEGTGKGNGEATVKAGGVLQLKKKLGNTVCVNQLVDKSGFPASKTENYITFTNNGDGSVTANGTASATVVFEFQNYQPTELTIGHKYYIQSGFTTTGSGSTFELMLTQVTAGGNVNLYGFSQIFECGNNVNLHTLQFAVRNGATVNNLKCTPYLIDLTLWFGSNDRIPADLLAHPENWGRYYAGSLAYNAGTLESADGTVMRSIGRNCFDESTYTDAHNYIDISGLIINQTYNIMCANTSGLLQFKISATSGTAAVWSSGTLTGATFTLTENLKSIGKLWIINSSYGAATPAQIQAAKVCLSIYYPGESGYDQYYPYSVLAEVDTGSEVLRSAGAVADEKTPDGTITRRVGVVDLGTIDYFYESGYSRISHLIGAEENIKIPDGSDIPNARIIPFKVVSSATGWAGRGGSENLFCIDSTGYLRFYTTQYSSAAAFKTAMSGVYLYYELATPTTEQGTAFAENIPCDPDGTLNWTQSAGIPQGNEIFYPADLKGDLESILTAIPSANGTYTLHATVTTAGVTFSWS